MRGDYHMKPICCMLKWTGILGHIHIKTNTEQLHSVKNQKHLQGWVFISFLIIEWLELNQGFMLLWLLVCYSHAVRLKPQLLYSNPNKGFQGNWKAHVMWFITAFHCRVFPGVLPSTYWPCFSLQDQGRSAYTMPPSLPVLWGPHYCGFYVFQGRIASS